MFRQNFRTMTKNQIAFAKPLTKNLLIPLGLTVAAATDAAIHKNIFGSSTTTLAISNIEMNDIMKIGKKLFFFYLGFFSQPFTNHRTAGEGEGYFFNSLLLLPSTDTQTLAGQLLQRTHLCRQAVAGLEPGAFGF